MKLDPNWTPASIPGFLMANNANEWIVISDAIPAKNGMVFAPNRTKRFWKIRRLLYPWLYWLPKTIASRLFRGWILASGTTR